MAGIEIQFLIGLYFTFVTLDALFQKPIVLNALTLKFLLAVILVILSMFHLGLLSVVR